ncbi:MAG: 16S rRNA (cytosine(1402)-N(4))-methyltransferase RsmH [bacterium]|nr:16S rRNA (cytosine(1402)-N(4))-methyltransferase RsmH [bacterium]
MKNEKYHEPVLVCEVLTALGLVAPLNTRARIIDATVGTGGHSLELVKRGVNVLGIEADKKMVEIARERLKAKIVHGNFINIDKIASDNKFTNIDGVIFDLGVSNIQLLSDERGFSFLHEEALLDMRLDKDGQGVNAADLLNCLREDQLKKMFSVTLMPNQVNYIVKNILLAREIKPFRKVGDFVQICLNLKVKGSLHQATLPFLALRIAVNSELENLKEALPKAFDLLKTGGRLLVITFHSGEDKIVTKSFFGKSGRIMFPGEIEISNNPRARSAKLYVIEKK